ncbi:hypothetical protein ACFGVW_004413, partial [Shigella flexneri]
LQNDGHYFCGTGGNRPDGLNEPVTFQVSLAGNPCVIRLVAQVCMWLKFIIRDRGGFSGGLLLFLPVCCRDRTERILAVHTIKILR